MTDDAQTASPAAADIPPDTYGLSLSADNVVTGAAHSNVAQPGLTAVSADVYAAVRSFGFGRCTFDGTSVAAFAPPPPPAPPRRATLSALFDPLSPAQRAAITADHLMRLQADAAAMPDGTVFVGSSKVARAAADLAMTADAWFTMAGS